MPLSRSPLRLLAGDKPVAFTIHLQDVDMMGEPVEQSTSKSFRTEYGCPFIEWRVAGDESGTTLIGWLDTSKSSSEPTAVNGT
jgi:hypothetical protein